MNIKSLTMMCGLAVCLLVQPARSGELLVLDSWWDADYAKQSCESAERFFHDNAAIIKQFGCEAVGSCQDMTALSEACMPNSGQDITTFENNLITQLAASPDCSGIEVSVYKGPNQRQSDAASEMMQKLNWSLSINWFGGGPKQHWQLMMSDFTHYSEGENDIPSMVRNVCTIVRQKGAKISN